MSNSTITAVSGLRKREVNGRVQRESVEEIRSIVLAQRAKMGIVGKDLMDQRAESEFGRFCIKAKVRDEFYRAGLAYEDVIHRARVAKGFISSLWSGGDNISPMTPEQIELAQQRMNEANSELLSVSPRCARACERLIIEGASPRIYDQDIIINGLMKLAMHFGLWKPFHAT